MLAGNKDILFNFQLTSNIRRIQEADRTFPHSGPLVGNSGTHVKHRSDNHSDPDQMGGVRVFY